MLCLTRFPGDSIYIGDNITIVILETYDDGMVRIGIEAPKEIPIVRDNALRTRPKPKRN